MENPHVAYLSNRGPCICFSYGGKNIRFMGPKSLSSFQRVTTWDRGYLVVDAKWKKNLYGFNLSFRNGNAAL